MKKKAVLICILLYCSIFRINSIYALSRSIDVDGETLDDTISTNLANTAFYDYDNNVLTLTNYDGGPIQYYDCDLLTVVLVGNNTITSDFMYEGIVSYADINIEGEGTLLIKNTYTGIMVYDGNLKINSNNIIIENVFDQALSVMGGKIIINGKVSIDSDAELIEQEFGYYDGYMAINATDDIEINNDVLVENAKKGINSNGNIIVESGISNIKTEGTGVHTAKAFSINGGKIDIEVTSNDNFLPIYGIEAGSINIEDGYLHVLVPENNIGMVSWGEFEEEPSITIDDSLMINPQYSVIDIEPVPEYYAKTLGLTSDEIANEITIYAKKTVTFDTDGGSSIPNQELIYGSLITIGEAPVKDDYTFTGWYQDINANDSFDFDTPITKDITLHAKWIKEYNVTVTVNDEKMGTVSATPTKATEGTQISLTAQPKTGYHFINWQTQDASIDVSTGIFNMPNKDITIKAIFESDTPTTYKVSFNNNNGFGTMEDITGVTGTYILPANKFNAPDGKQFKGWSLSDNGEIITQINMDENKIVYAIWEDQPVNYDYVFIKGDNQQLTIDDIKEYTFTIDGDYTLFESLKIGNLDLIKDKDYKVTEGSTIITFTKNGIDKLNTLSKGKYEIVIKYSNEKEVKGNLILNTITPSGDNTENPKTGDNYSLYILTGFISLLGLIGSSFYAKRKY